MFGALLPAVIGAGASIIGSKNSQPQQQQTQPWAPAIPYLTGDPGERRLREGVEPIYGPGGGALLSFDEWVNQHNEGDYGQRVGEQQAIRSQYDNYAASNPDQILMNPDSDFEMAGGSPGVLNEAQTLYQEGGLTPEQIALNDSHNAKLQHQYDSMGNSILNNSNELYSQMLNGAFVPDRQSPNQITPQQIESAQNTFNPNAQAQEWQANTVDPASLAKMEAAQLGPASQAQAATVGPVAQANAAQNQGYTPTGQVKDFMEGEAYNNPFLDRMFDSASRKMGQQFNEQIMSGITDNAVATGGYGGSRQGIAEGIAARGAADALGDLANNMYGNAYSQGFGAMSGLTSQQMAGGINQAAQNANLNQQANMNNANFQNQGIFQNASNQQGTNIFNAGANNQFGLAQGGMNQQANAYNPQVANQATFGNQAVQNQANMSNAGANNTFGLTNQNLGFGAATQNTNNQQATNVQNVANDLNSQRVNAGLTLQDNAQALNFGQSDLQNRLGAAGALGQGLTMNDAMYGSLMSGYGAGQDADWSNLGNYANIVLPAAGLGQTGTITPSTNPLAAGVGGALAGMSLYNQFGGANLTPNYQGQAQPLYNNAPYVGMM